MRPFDRYLEKMKAFIRTPGLQQERMEDLLRRIKANLPALEEWFSEAEDHWGEEDGVYRFYHQSWKVFDRLQPSAAEISNKLFSSGVCNSRKRLVLLLLAISAIIVTSLPVKADEDRGDHNWNDEYWHHNHDGYLHGHKGHWEYKHHKHTFIQVGPVTIEQH